MLPVFLKASVIFRCKFLKRTLIGAEGGEFCHKSCRSRHRSGNQQYRLTGFFRKNHILIFIEQLSLLIIGGKEG